MIIGRGVYPPRMNSLNMCRTDTGRLMKSEKKKKKKSKNIIIPEAK